MVPEPHMPVSGLGALPSNWQVRSASSLCSKITKGTTPKKAENDEVKTIPFLRVTNLSFDGKVNLESDLIFVRKSEHRGSLSRSIAFPGDILMNIVGPPLGKIGRLEDTYPEYNMNQAIVFYRLDSPEINEAYFLEYLQSYVAQQWLQSRSKKTSGQQNLTIELCKELPVPLPPLSEQLRIAEVLAKWNRVVEVASELLTNSLRRRQALMQQLLTGKRRLPGFEGEWEEARLRQFIVELKSRNRGETVSRVLSVSNKHGFILPEEQFSKRVASENVSNYKVVERGQYAYNPSRLNVGSFARLDEFKNGVVSPMYVVFSVDQEKLDNDYYLHWMNSHQAQGRIGNLTQGSVRDSVSFDALGSLPISVPPVQEQIAIASVLTIADHEIELLHTQLASLCKEKKALMQQLLTGRRRVKVDKEPA